MKILRKRMKSELLKGVTDQLASSWGNVSPQHRTFSGSFISLHSLYFPLFIPGRIDSGKMRSCCQIVVTAGYLLSDSPRENPS